MKKKINLTLLGLTVLLSPACKKEKIKNVTIIKDCSGVYIQKNNEDYLVCNDDLLENYNTGDELNVTYKKIDNCNFENKFFCMMVHAHEGVVEILEVR